MDGFLGTRALIQSDVALVLTWVLLAAAAAGWRLARRRRFPYHCRTMAVAALLNWVPALVVMLVPWWGLAAQGVGALANVRMLAPLAHGAAGIVAQLLMTYTVVRMYWLKRLPPRRTHWLMMAAWALWLLATVGGTGVYLLLYVL
jgi:uncharacterized membrane protein YozB (DUF420 family)